MNHLWCQNISSTCVSEGNSAQYQYLGAAHGLSRQFSRTELFKWANTPELSLDLLSVSNINTEPGQVTLIQINSWVWDASAGCCTENSAHGRFSLGIRELYSDFFSLKKYNFFSIQNKRLKLPWHHNIKISFLSFCRVVILTLCLFCHCVFFVLSSFYLLAFSYFAWRKIVQKLHISSIMYGYHLTFL